TTPPTLTPTTTIESAPRLSATAKGKQPSRETTPVEPTDFQRTEAEQLKIDKETGKCGDEVRESEGESDDEETREEEDENFDPIPKTPEESEEESNDEEEQELRLNAVSAIPSIIHQYMDQQMKETVREAVQIQTDRLQDSL
nr:hypothetical protein [Tanacetum cinerariifolium]